jgi:hypothetical protein
MIRRMPQQACGAVMESEGPGRAIPIGVLGGFITIEANF